MDFYPVSAFFICIAIIVSVAATPLFGKAFSPAETTSNRAKTIDGLRGFLALAVVFHHASLYHGLHVNDKWELPPSRFYALLGPIGVSMFFMVTGYLFWGRLIRDRSKPLWLRFYVTRAFRVGPLYVLAVSVALFIAFVKSGFTIYVSQSRLAIQLIRWIASLGLAGPGPFNGAGQPESLLGVTWTIQWEWFFYLALPILFLATRKNRMHLRFVAGCLVLALTWLTIRGPGRPGQPTMAAIAILFLLGMLSASLQNRGIWPNLRDWKTSVLLLVFIAAVFAFPNIYSLGPVLLLGGAFFLVATGTTLFGILTTQAARHLGDISYGVYLFQGLALGTVYGSSLGRSLAPRSPLYHWSLALLAALALVGLATLVHNAVEQPGIALGKRMNNWLHPKP